MAIIDLTLALRPGMRGFAIEPKHRLERDGWNSSTLDLYSHAGTHMDAPVHFGCGPTTIDQWPIDRFLGPAVRVDLRPVEPGELIDLDRLGSLASGFPRGHSLVLQTGWSEHVDDPAIFRDGLPRIAEDLARWCVDNAVNILGVEAPSVADVNNLDEVTRIHTILLSGGVIIVEGLCNLDALPGNHFTLGAFPLRIENGDGCPCRAFAMSHDSLA